MQISESRRRFVNPTRRSKNIDDTEHDLLWPARLAYDQYTCKILIKSYLWIEIFAYWWTAQDEHAFHAQNSSPGSKLQRPDTHRNTARNSSTHIAIYAPQANRFHCRQCCNACPHQTFDSVNIKSCPQNFQEISPFFHFVLASLYTSHLAAFSLHKQCRRLEVQARLRVEVDKLPEHGTWKQENGDQHVISPFDIST